jgi:AcrR family transcriptional regulator
MSSEGRKRAKRKPPEVRAAEIRDAACAIALETGLYSVTLRAIATRVGVAPALVAHYEPNMEALLAASFTRIVQAELTEVSEHIPDQSSPTAALRHLISTLLEPGRAETTAIWLDAWSLGRRVDLISLAVRQQMDAWQDFVLGIMQAGLASGEFATDEPDTVAWQLVGMIDGLNAQALVHYRDASSRSRLIVRAMELGLGLPIAALTDLDELDHR